MTGHTDVAPHSGAIRAARSALHSDAPHLDLCGQWRFRLLSAVPGTPGAHGILPAGEGAEDFTAEDYDDASWDLLPVPAHWVLHGDGAYGRPIYTNVQFPFPIDPPHVPSQNPTGDYRRQFTVDPHWLDSGTVVLRFDGVESYFRLWVNGEEVGAASGSRLAHEFDVTEVVRAGLNTLALRVVQWSAASYLEDQDQWWLPGIFREVTAIHRPDSGIEDVWLHADWDPVSGAGSLHPQVVAAPAAYPIEVHLPELDLQVRWDGPEQVGPVAVGAVRPWSAEEPVLYEARVRAAGEEIGLRVGFRRVQIRGDRLLVNGRRLVLSGMNRHETHPDRGRVFDAEDAREDLMLMKQHNVNAIRTSHYPPHPGLLDLADELGLWVVLECDLETHGFQAGDWAGNPSDDPQWREAFLDRIERTVERDKNHPSIVMWSLGNESGTGRNLAEMAAWVRRRDPSRPVHYEGDYTGAYTDVYSRMYASPAETVSIGSDGDYRPLLGCSVAESTRQRSKPFIHCEYAHAMGNGPGALAEYRQAVEDHPRLHGGFVWEWRDHGIRTRTTEGTEYFAYGGDFGEVVHDANFVMDGMVLSDSTPTPGLAEFAAVEAPVVLRAGETGQAHLRNRYMVSDTAHLELAWRLEADGYLLAEGISPAASADGAPVAAGTSAQVALFDGPPRQHVPEGTEATVTVEARLREAARWAPAGHVVSRGQWPLMRTGIDAAGRPEVRTGGPRAAGASGAGAGSAVELPQAPVAFAGDALVELAGAPVAGPDLELWRAPTDNDEGASSPNLDRHDPRAFGEGEIGPATAERWRAQGMHRLTSRVRQIEADQWRRTVRRRVAAAASPACLEVTENWTACAGGDGQVEAVLEVTASPDGHWDDVWPRLGVHLRLPTDVDGARWFGLGPHDGYPDAMSSLWLGRHEAGIEDLTVQYARPQESGHRPGLRELTLLRAGRPWLSITTVADEAGRRPGFTLARHSAHEVTAAAHPHELPRPTAHHLYLDMAQHGLGSRACGPDVLPEAMLRPQALTLRVRLRAL